MRNSNGFVICQKIKIVSAASAALKGVHFYEIVDEWIADKMLPYSQSRLHEVVVQRYAFIDERAGVWKFEIVVYQAKFVVLVEMRSKRKCPALDRPLLTRTDRRSLAVDEADFARP